MEENLKEDLKEKREKLVKAVKGFFSADSSGEKDELSRKREEFVRFLKEKKKWLIYLGLLAIIIFGVWIRAKNFWLLKDITTGAWLSIDLDSHIYLKYARTILEQGFLPAIDPQRFVPLGAPTANYAFPAYIIYYLYKAMHLFDPSVTIEYADVVYPIIAFAIGVFFFFLLARRLFDTKVALPGSFFLAIVPAFLQRTMGGSSDHDALGIMFMFIAMYFFIVAWQSKTIKWAALWGIAAGLMSGLTGLSWGAWKFLGLLFGLFVLIEFFLKGVEPRQVLLYVLWWITTAVVMIGWVPLFPLKSFITSMPTAFPLFVLLVLAVDLVLFKYNFLKARIKVEEKIPRPLAALLLSFLIIAVIAFLVLGIGEIGKQLHEAKLLLLHPMGKDRWELTVAEQHQPYFTDLVASFGPDFVGGIPLFFTLFLAGMVILLYRMQGESKKKILPTLVFSLFILVLWLSRRSPQSIFDGKSNLSVLVYLGSFVALIGLSLYFYLHTFYKKKEIFQQLRKWDSQALFVLVWLVFMVIAARGAIRLFFLVAPVITLLAAYGVVEISTFIFTFRRKASQILTGFFLLFILLSPLAYPFQGVIPNFAQASIKQATYHGPPYNQQWQIAGAWVKENIPKEAVFGHWWDYGYWVQNGWERASVLDGANKVKYWNYLMGRHVLCAQNQTEALEFLKVHNTTHYLIVSDEIGKYTAYSSIGADENYDRYSWITTFRMNPEATQETRNETVFVYQGGFVLDDDFVWNNMVYPRGEAGIGAVFLPVQERKEIESNITKVSLELRQPTAALVYREKRVDIPLECVYFNGKMLKFDKPGLKGCFRMIPTLDDKGQPDNLLGAGMYVSEEGVKALWVNLYIFEQNNPEFDTSAFKSIYEDKYISTIAFYRGSLIGPIKIWEIKYPKGFRVSKELESLYLGGNELLPEYFFEV